MNSFSDPYPLACVMGAIPAAERPAHVALTRELFGRMLEARPLEKGYLFRFAGFAFQLLADFIRNERLCCPFLTFTLTIGDVAARIELEITGPEGTRQFLEAELPLPVGDKGISNFA